jgi:hypothetical protein
MIDKKVKKNRPVMMSEQAHKRLMWVSKVTGKSQKGILEDFISELFSLSINYDQATLKIESSVLNDNVTAILHGYGKKLKMGSFPMSASSSDKEVDEEILKKFNEAVKPNDSTLVMCPDCSQSFNINLKIVSDIVYCPRCKAPLDVLGVA